MHPGLGRQQAGAPHSGWCTSIMGPATKIRSLAKPKIYLDAENKKSSVMAKESATPRVSIGTSTL